MPKIKDLGINAIPLMMQPPAIGDGGGGQDDDKKKHDDQDHDEDDYGQEPTDELDCIDPPPPHPQETHECLPEDETRKVDGFTPEAIAQLRQQIADRSANV